MDIIFRTDEGQIVEGEDIRRCVKLCPISLATDVIEHGVRLTCYEAVKGLSNAPDRCYIYEMKNVNPGCAGVASFSFTAYGKYDGEDAAFVLFHGWAHFYQGVGGWYHHSCNLSQARWEVAISDMVRQCKEAVERHAGIFH